MLNAPYLMKGRSNSNFCMRDVLKPIIVLFGISILLLNKTPEQIFMQLKPPKLCKVIVEKIQLLIWSFNKIYKLSQI